MIFTEFRSEELPAEERFDAWQELMSHSLISMAITSEHTGDYRAALRMIDLGSDLKISTMQWPSSRMYRTPKMVRQSDPEQLHMTLLARGQAGLTAAGRQGIINAREMLVYDSSRPFECRGIAERNSVLEGTVIHAARTSVPLRADSLDRLIALPLSGSTGIGAVLATYVTELTRNADRYQPGDVARLASITTDLVTAVCAHHLENASVPPETHHRVLLLRIHDFIRQQLGDPGLSPTTIAATHQISLRHLHRLFHAQGVTVADWIRHRRLEHARRDLADPQLNSRPIHAIATCWGFSHAAHFTRVFRRTYGVTPTEYRQTRSAGEDSPSTDRR